MSSRSWPCLILVVGIPFILVGLWIRCAAMGVGGLRQGLEREWRDWIGTHRIRAPVRGWGRPRNGWDFYLNALEACPQEERIQLPGDHAAPPPPQVTSILDALRSGAESRVVEYQEDPQGHLCLDYPGITNLFRAVAWSVRHCLHVGRPDQAVDLCMDFAWFGADLVRAGDTFGPRALLRAVSTAAWVHSSRPRETGPLLGAALQRFEKVLPGPSALLLRAEIRLAEQALRSDPPRPGPFCRTGAFQRWIAWQVDRPIHILDMHTTLACLRRQRELVDTSWSDFRRSGLDLENGVCWASLAGIRRLGGKGHWFLATRYRRAIGRYRQLLAVTRSGEEVAQEQDRVEGR